MPRIDRAIVLSLLGTLLFFAPFGSASLFEPVSDRELVCEATDIVRAHIINVQSAWDNEHVAIWTTATMQVDAAIRGSLDPGTQIQVKEVGGTVGDYTIAAEDFPTFRSGDEVVVLLKPWEDESGIYRVWGYGRGMFIVGARDGREPTASRHDVVKSGKATLHTDRIPATLVLDALNRELGRLASTCGP